MVLLQSWGNIESQATELSHAVSDLCWILAGIFSLYGGYRIYYKWQLHHHHLHIDAEVLSWVGGAVFFLCAAKFNKMLF